MAVERIEAAAADRDVRAADERPAVREDAVEERRREVEEGHGALVVDAVERERQVDALALPRWRCGHRAARVRRVEPEHGRPAVCAAVEAAARVVRPPRGVAHEAA